MSILSEYKQLLRQDTPFTIKKFKYGPPVHIILDPKLVTHILIRNAKNYRKGTIYKLFAFAFGNGLIPLTNEKTWVRHRKVLNHQFNKTSLDNQISTINDHWKHLVNEWKTDYSNAPIPLATELATQITSLTTALLFGVSLTKAEAQELATISNSISEWGFGTSSEWNVSPLTRFFPTPKNLQALLNVRKFKSKIRNILTQKQRQHAQSTPPNLLDIMIESMAKSGGLKRKEVLDELGTFYMAALDTTLASLTAVLHLVATHPEVQEKLVGECQAFQSLTTPTLSDTFKLDYCEQVILETIRLYPPVHSRQELTCGPDTFYKTPIPKNSPILIPIQVLHRNPNFWDRPHKFVPERFADPEFRQSVEKTGYYLPFNLGKRMCIGKHLAMAEMKMMLAHVVANFKLSVPENTDLDFHYWLTLVPKSSNKLLITSR